MNLRVALRLLADDGWFLVRTRGSQQQCTHAAKPISAAGWPSAMLIAAATLLTTPLHAQTQIRGVVVDSGGRPLAEADVILPGVGLRMRTESRPSRYLVELWNGQRPMEADEGFPPDMIWRPNDVVAIEYYDDYRKVPARYQSHVVKPGQQPCDLVIYWLRGAAGTGDQDRSYSR